MACWTCKGPDVPRLIAEWGEDGYFGAKWAKGGPEIVNSIGLLLTVTTPHQKTLQKANLHYVLLVHTFFVH